MLKILAGEYRSRRLLTPDNDTTRPYTGRVRNSVFGMLHGWFEDAHVLDLYAGVGTVGLEAVSRGASRVVLVERDRRVFRLLQRNIESLGCGDRARAIHGDVLGAATLARAPYPVDLAFVDPPYENMKETRSRSRVFGHMAQLRKVMATRSYLVLRTPLNPFETPHDIEGMQGPEAHQYRPDMWVLLYQPLIESPSDNPNGAAVPSTE